MRRQARVLPIVLLCCSLISLSGCSRPAARQASTGADDAAGQTTDKFVREPARQIPILYDVDVVVVGGTSGAVAAAVAAAAEGAKVFLAAPRPYLGEDICGTYRLWLEPDEEPASPLARAMFAEPQAATQLRESVPFTYEADAESAPQHKDSAPPSALKDGKWHSAPSQSVQYNSDVNIVADLGTEQFVDSTAVMAYQRNGEFEVASVTISVSSDKQQWRQATVVENAKLGQGSFEDTAIALSAAVGQKARYLKFAIRKPPAAKRVLLGEILIGKAERSDRAGPSNPSDADAGEAGS